ncbi:unnamed protein product, partial [Arabidopsis halleri]
LRSCSWEELASQLEQDRDEEQTHQFLMGLDDVRFGGIRFTLTNMEPLLKLSQVYQRVSNERKQSITRNKEERSDAMGFRFKRVTEKYGKPETFQYREKDTTYTYCGKYGHEISDCFQIKGYPNWWRERRRNFGEVRDINRGGRGRFGRGGGAVSGYGKGKSSLAHANVAQTLPDVLGSALSVLAQPVANSASTTRRDEGYDRLSLSLLSDDQKTALIELLTSQKTAKSEAKLSGKTKMIIDSGVSHHMTLIIDSFSDVTSIAPCSVRLPDGDCALAEK